MSPPSGPAHPGPATPPEDITGTRVGRLFRMVVGAPRNPLDPKIFHTISLAAFFAWIGLGVDGLSSSAYGPEEAFKALQQALPELAIFKNLELP